MCTLIDFFIISWSLFLFLVVLTVGITEVDYDYNSQNLTITVKLLKGKLSPEESVTINISIILVTEGMQL